MHLDVGQVPSLVDAVVVDATPDARCHELTLVDLGQVCVYECVCVRAPVCVRGYTPVCVSVCLCVHGYVYVHLIVVVQDRLRLHGMAPGVVPHHHVMATFSWRPPKSRRGTDRVREQCRAYMCLHARLCMCVRAEWATFFRFLASVALPASILCSCDAVGGCAGFRLRSGTPAITKLIRGEGRRSEGWQFKI